MEFHPEFAREALAVPDSDYRSLAKTEWMPLRLDVVDDHWWETRLRRSTGRGQVCIGWVQKQKIM